MIALWTNPHQMKKKILSNWNKKKLTLCLQACKRVYIPFPIVIFEYQSIDKNQG